MKNAIQNTLCIFSTLLLFFICHQTQAQSRVSAYTGSNTIIVNLEGKTGPYQYSSKDLLVRYNKATQKIECVLNLGSLYPTNENVPPTMAYDVLYGAKYPDLVLLIDAPAEKANASNNTNIYPESLGKKTSISLQGITNQTVIPVLFTPDRNTIFFSTNFDLMLDNFQASIPAKYLPILTGRIQIFINNAKWTDIESQ
ncbi:hypothetical protein ACFSKU_16130 [Pontibacter silvestris]|uniref:Uncharacterized protein n=1 Tax=Pontibacter silvestris TaxID=2305183 RepID=A0ABW4X0G7_9BACT|nr:hypothetical protein [Pontibacter silvestris]MCC9135999.1 hypothetical protein [Pontibacter silvestris]